MAAFVGTASPDVLLDMKLDDDRYIGLLRKLISEVKGTAPMISRTACADTIARAAFRTAVRARARVFFSAPLLNSVPRCCIGPA